MKEAMLGMCSSIYYLSARGNAMCLVNEMLMLRTDKFDWFCKCFHVG